MAGTVQVALADVYNSRGIIIDSFHCIEPRSSGSPSYKYLPLKLFHMLRQVISHFKLHIIYFFTRPANSMPQFFQPFKAKFRGDTLLGAHTQQQTCQQVLCPRCTLDVTISPSRMAAQVILCLSSTLNPKAPFSPLLLSSLLSSNWNYLSIS